MSSYALFAAAALVTSVSAAFDPTSKTNVVTYWGQGANQARLVEVCRNQNADVVNIGFVNIFPDQGPGGWPGTNFGNQCYGDVYQHDGVDTALLKTCPYISQDVAACQQMGVKVFLSIGGGHPTNYYNKDSTSGQKFAEFLWDAFGGGSSPDVPRPWGSSVVDGFDFDIESSIASPPNAPADYKQSGYAAMVNRFRDLFAMDSSKTYYISGSPQCIVPDNHFKDVIRQSSFDFLWVQFYNTPACSARTGINAMNGNGNGADITFNNWNGVASLNPDVKIYLGLPASSLAANKDQNYNLSLTEAQSLVNRFSRLPRFGGIMVWEATFSAQNVVCKDTYINWMKKILLNHSVDTTACQPSASTTTSKASSATKTTSSSTTTTTTTTTTAKASTTTSRSSTLRTSSSSTFTTTAKASTTTSKSSSSAATSTVKRLAPAARFSTTTTSSSTSSSTSSTTPNTTPSTTPSTTSKISSSSTATSISSSSLLNSSTTVSTTSSSTIITSSTTSPSTTVSSTSSSTSTFDSSMSTMASYPPSYNTKLPGSRIPPPDHVKPSKYSGGPDDYPSWYPGVPAPYPTGQSSQGPIASPTQITTESCTTSLPSSGSQYAQPTETGTKYTYAPVPAPTTSVTKITTIYTTVCPITGTYTHGTETVTWTQTTTSTITTVVTSTVVLPTQGYTFVPLPYPERPSVIVMSSYSSPSETSPSNAYPETYVASHSGSIGSAQPSPASYPPYPHEKAVAPSSETTGQASPNVPASYPSPTIPAPQRSQYPTAPASNQSITRPSPPAPYAPSAPPTQSPYTAGASNLRTTLGAVLALGLAAVMLT